jgi:hypothetical protein
MGARATARTLEKSHSTILGWEQRLAQKSADWSPPAPSDKDITLEGDELYTRVHGNFSPQDSQGWTINFLEWNSRYWLIAPAGKKESLLFEIRWFTDGEKRYAQKLWRLASIYLEFGEADRAYRHRKVWHEGLEVAMKVKRSQSRAPSRVG